MKDTKKPVIYWLEGLLAYYESPFPHEAADPRRFGFEVGQRIIGLYLSEMLLKYALDEHFENYSDTHSLYRLFQKLPREKRKAANLKYRELLNNSVKQTWTFARSLIALVKELGDNPIKDTRYFWHKNYKVGPHILSPDLIRPLVYSLLIVLHNYPEQSGRTVRRYKTRFVDFKKSLKSGTRDAGISLHTAVWLEGLLDYFNTSMPDEKKERQRIGFSVGRQVIGLHLVEMILKYKLDELGIGYEYDHDLAALFSNIPTNLRDESEQKYQDILSGYSEAWDIARSIESLLQYYGPAAITETRYFWEPTEHREGPRSIVFSINTLYLLVHALFISLHSYPEKGLPYKNNETRFIPLEDPETGHSKENDQ